MKPIAAIPAAMVILFLTSCGVQTTFHPILELENGSSSAVTSPVVYQVHFSGYTMGSYQFFVEANNNSTESVSLDPSKWILRSVTAVNDTTNSEPNQVSPINPDVLQTRLLEVRRTLVEKENPYKSTYFPGVGTIAVLGIIADIKNPPSEAEQVKRDREEMEKMHRENERMHNELLWEQNRQENLTENHDLSDTVLHLPVGIVA